MSDKQILGVIPARYGSTRFPGKPLAIIGGRTMIERVYRQCEATQSLNRVIIATDDERIFDAIMAFGGEVCMTRNDHPTGTARLLEVASLMPGYAGYINIQGDEPFIRPEQINAVAEPLVDGEILIATLAKSINDPAELLNPNCVKVVRSATGRALYFSRAAVPYLRSVEDVTLWPGQFPFSKHIGIYGFTAAALQQIARLAPSKLAEAEALEQLQWLESGIPITTYMTEWETPAVDVPEDILKIEQLLATGSL